MSDIIQFFLPAADDFLEESLEEQIVTVMIEAEDPYFDDVDNHDMGGYGEDFTDLDSDLDNTPDEYDLDAGVGGEDDD